jgi:alkylation response protein AidB-like acyl-CoA dehydrogenase
MMRKDLRAAALRCRSRRTVIVTGARAAHVTVQRAVVTVTQEAIRVCGGRAFLRRYPLERYARDARAAALMRPWTQELATQQAWEAALGLDAQRGTAAGA